MRVIIKTKPRHAEPIGANSSGDDPLNKSRSRKGGRDVKNIETILAEANVEGEQAKTIADLVNANYKTIAEYSANREQRDKALEQVAELTERVEQMGASEAEVAKLKDELELARKEAEDKEQAAREKAERSEYEKELEAILEGRTFVNDLTRDAIIDKCWERHQANPDEATAVTFDAVTDGAEGIFTARAKVKPPAGAEGGAEPDDGLRGMVAKLFPTD